MPPPANAAPTEPETLEARLAAALAAATRWVSDGPEAAPTPAGEAVPVPTPREARPAADPPAPLADWTAAPSAPLGDEAPQPPPTRPVVEIGHIEVEVVRPPAAPPRRAPARRAAPSSAAPARGPAPFGWRQR